MNEDRCIRARVYGIVQGVGFRPFVSRIADAHQLKGSVCNKGPYVEIDAQGAPEKIQDFLYELEHRPPERAVILKLEVEEAPELRGVYARFDIVESAKEQGEIFVSPDIAICPTCKKEMYDRNNRRYLHPFINCTACGPRMTILDGMPYDRERTSMKNFPMCPTCAYEYTHPETRRYDAQPVCCNDCGPQVYLLRTDGTQTLPAEIEKMGPEEKDLPAIRRTQQRIRDGGIVAIKGIGGFHLCCDATNEQAVQRLRALKHRPVKPFAVMMKDLDAVRRECEVTPLQEEILDGHQKPILLLEKKGYYSEAPAEECRLAPSIAPGNPKVGVMLPYAPVQLLLFDSGDGLAVPDCLVMTSGNISGAPICRDDEDALRELSRMCDGILSHNRLIRLRADDTVMDTFRGEPYMIRRSRGYAPLPFMMPWECRGTVLGIGGELKNTFCIAKHRLFYPSPYVGDMEDLRTVRALEESVTRMEHLLEAEPEIVACDLHPKYNTSAVAKNLGLPVLEIQHHYAHILSCMAENETSDPVIGVSFDGTGYGTDGTIWGGEFLRADYNGFDRIGSVEPFLQVGGDASAREGWRIAVSILYRHTRDREKTKRMASALQLCDAQNLQAQFLLSDRNINTVVSTSAGRLFDAVSAILGIRRTSTFEGEASTALQFAAQNGRIRRGQTNASDRPLREENGRFVLPTEELVWELAQRKLRGEDSEQLALEFHEALAAGIIWGCERAREETGLSAAALSGGVFQNTLLLEFCLTGLEERGFRVYRHHMIPPNDGGIALGQAAAAMWVLNRKKE